MSLATTIPLALIVQTDELPWAHDVLAPGLSIKVLISDIEGGFLVVKTRFQPGTVIPTHMHTGAVHGFTESGRWFYREYGDESVNVAGSYIYEPAGSTHTLEAPADNTEPTDAYFIIHGAFINYDADGNYVGYIDAANTRELYVTALERQGDRVPSFIQGGSCSFTD